MNADLIAAGWKHFMAGIYDAWESPEGKTYGTTAYAWAVLTKRVDDPWERIPELMKQRT